MTKFMFVYEVKAERKQRECTFNLLSLCELLENSMSVCSGTWGQFTIHLFSQQFFSLYFAICGSWMREYFIINKQHFSGNTRIPILAWLKYDFLFTAELYTDTHQGALYIFKSKFCGNHQFCSYTLPGTSST